MTESLSSASSRPEGEAETFQNIPLNQVSLPKLRRWLLASLNLAELNNFTFDLGIDIEQISGDIKSERVVSLLTHIQRHGRLRELLLLLDEEREDFTLDTVQRTVVDPSADDSERVIEADQGIRAVQAHLDDPNVREAINNFRTDFQIIEHELRRLYSLKQIHDLLQTLEYQYSLLDNDQKRLSGQELWDSIFFTAPEIELILDDLLAAAASDSLNPQDVRWTDQASKLKSDLHQAVEETDTIKLTAVTRTLFRFINRQPTRINVQLVSTVRGLRLDTLARAMTVISEALAPTEQHDNAVEQLNDAIAAFINIEERVNALATDHDTWQQLDDELRQVEATLGQDLEEIEDAWFFLRQLARELYIEKDEDWAVELTNLTIDLDQALGNRVVITFKRLFRRYNTLANRRFHWVDRQLLALGKQLQQIGGSLNDLLRTLR
ncbi:MAG: hypothetical protein AAF614_13715 [Chloroflexota bacterium]